MDAAHFIGLVAGRPCNRQYADIVTTTHKAPGPAAA